MKSETELVASSGRVAAPDAAVGQPELLRALGLWGATSIVMGSMIGSAIFVVPSEITRQVCSPLAGLTVWLAAGVLSLFGALSFAELAAMMPQAGGQYVYLREAYGSFTSFLFGWIFFLAVQSGGIAAVASGLARYVTNFLPLSAWQQHGVAGGVILVLTVINYCGVREGGRVQSVLTGMNVGMVIALIVLGYALVRGPASGTMAYPVRPGIGFLSSFGVAAAAALWAYDGWNTITFAAAEVSRPARSLPLALFIGTGSVVAIYVALNTLYYYVLTPSEIARSPHVAADVAARIIGSKGSQVVALAIIVSAFGSANASVLGGARVYYAMAKDGLFFRWCAAVHPRFHTPHLALVAQAAWSVLLVSFAGYEQLFTYTVFAAWIFYALTALGVIILRQKKPELRRPYRVFAYPWVPITFVLAAVLFIANTLIEKPVEAGWGCALAGGGVPAYFVWRKTTRRKG